MSLTVKLYHLREVIENTPEFKAYEDAKKKALNDEKLQILFGEFDRYSEMHERFGSYQSSDDQKRHQQLKIKIFENENYKNHKKTEKELNQLRYIIAKRLFSTLDEEMYVEGLLTNGGTGKCGL